MPSLPIYWRMRQPCTTGMIHRLMRYHVGLSWVQHPHKPSSGQRTEACRERTYFFRRGRLSPLAVPLLTKHSLQLQAQGRSKQGEISDWQGEATQSPCCHGWTEKWRQISSTSDLKSLTQLLISHITMVTETSISRGMLIPEPWNGSTSHICTQTLLHQSAIWCTKANK